MKELVNDHEGLTPVLEPDYACIAANQPATSAQPVLVERQV